MFPLRRRLAGMAVHLDTASGSVLALLIVLAAFDGNVIMALWFGLVALVVDGTDGMLARGARVKETIPWFDGARLDDIVGRRPREAPAGRDGQVLAHRRRGSHTAGASARFTARRPGAPAGLH